MNEMARMAIDWLSQFCEAAVKIWSKILKKPDCDLSNAKFSVTGELLVGRKSERTKKFRVWVDSLKNDIFILNLHNIVNG